MLLIFMIIILQALVTFFIKGFIPDLQLYSFLLVSIIFIAVSIYLLKVLNKEWLLIIYSGFIIRIVIILIDLYVPSVNIFSSGTDTEYFHSASLDIANGIMPLSEGRTFYVTFLSGFYYLFGEQRVLAQLFNVVLWVFSAIYLLKALLLFDLRKNLILFTLLIFTLLPNGMFMSSILLRESLIVFFITLSLYYFLKWLKFKNMKDYFFALLLSLPAMIFHAGMVGFLFAYITAFIFAENHGTKGKRKNKLLYLMLITLVLIILLSNEDLFLTKFSSLQEEGIESISLANRGGSAYLQSFESLSSWKIFLLTPLKMIYFLFSPLPTDWRGLSDVISFLFDSLVYLFLFIMVFIGIFKSSLDKNIKVVILLMLFISTFIYAYGTGNAGTAMRHRYKLLPLLLIAYGLFSTRIRNKEKIDRKR